MQLDVIRAQAAHAVGTQHASPEAMAALHEAAEAHVDLTLGLVSALSALIKPLRRLDELVRFETARDGSNGNPLLSTLSNVILDCEVALSSNGITTTSDTVGDFFDEERHERVTRGGVAPADDLDELVVKEVVRPGYVHGATGAILCPALVVAAPVTKKPSSQGSSPSPHATPRGTRVHVLLKSDTLAGLALRYNVQQAALLRLNRIPSAHALHSRKTIRLPPPMAEIDHRAEDVSTDGCACNADCATLVTHPPTSLASRIAARRQASSERRRVEPTANALTEGHTTISNVTSSSHAHAVDSLEHALRASIERLPLEAQQRIAASTSEVVEPSGGANIDNCSGACSAWLCQAPSDAALAHAVASALLRPWLALVPNADSQQEMSFVRALGRYASEAAVLALLSHDGRMLRDVAAAVWQNVRTLALTEDDACGGGARQGAGAQAAPAGQYGASFSPRHGSGASEPYAVQARSTI